MNFLTHVIHPNRLEKMLPIFLTVGFFSVWELLARGGYISALFFPAPSRILLSLSEMSLNGRLATNLSATLVRLALGLTAGLVPGIALGLAMGWFPRLARLVDPFIAALHPVPKIAVFPLILIIFGIGEISKIVAIAISTFFPMVINSMAGVRQLPPVYFEVAQNYGARGWKTFQRVVWPGSLPMVLAGSRIAFAIALVVTIALELVAAREGLGVILWFAWQTFRTVELYSTLIVIALLGFLVNFGLKATGRFLAPWTESPEADSK